MPHRGRAGEEQVVERQRGKCLRHVRRAGDHDHVVGMEIARHQRGEQGRETRGEFAHLQHHAVARGQRIDQRPHGEVQRVIPRHDDAHHAPRLRPQLDARGQEQYAGQTASWRHPAPSVAQRMADRREAGEQLQQVGFLRWPAAEIGVDGGRQRRAMVMQQRAQRAQPARPHRPCGQGIAALRVAHALQRFVQCDVVGQGVLGGNGDVAHLSRCASVKAASAAILLGRRQKHRD